MFPNHLFEENTQINCFFYFVSILTVTQGLFQLQYTQYIYIYDRESMFCCFPYVFRYVAISFGCLYVLDLFFFDFLRLPLSKVAAGAAVCDDDFLIIFFLFWFSFVAFLLLFTVKLFVTQTHTQSFTFTIKLLKIVIYLEILHLTLPLYSNVCIFTIPKLTSNIIMHICKCLRVFLY